MSPFQSIILGIVQGLTEFLPVSSSAHLVVIPYLFGWQFSEPVAFVFDVLVQVATLVGVLAYFWKDLWAIALAVVRGLVNGKPLGDHLSRLGWFLILATIPAGVFGLLFKDAISAAFSNPVLVAFFLFITAGLMTAAEYVSKRTRNQEQMVWFDALWIGIFQAAATFPGISRSGATISGGMFRHFDRPPAARFSLLMSIPIMLAAGLLAGNDLISTPDLLAMLPAFLPGFIAAGVVGYLAIRWLLGYLVDHSLYIFSAYCTILGSLVIIVNVIR